MADVFISYSSKHRDLTADLAAHLDGCGLDVWWDEALVARGPFDAQIQEQLRLAKCVVVIWSEGAVQSEWVQIEAGIALEADKLVAVRADDLATSRIPEAFRRIDAHKIKAERDLLLRDVLAVREGRLLLEAKDDALPPSGNRTPTMLLQARYGLVKMVGAEHRIQDLVDWATSAGTYSKRNRQAAGRLIHGPGGFGKTRLLIEVTKRLRAAGWSAGFLARPPVSAGEERRKRYDDAIGYLIRGARDNGLCIVMDYAEGRNDEIEALAKRMLSRPADDMRPVRLVLLTRAAGDWWQAVIRQQAAQVLFDASAERADVHELTGIETPRQRLDLFVAAAQGFAVPLAEDGYVMPTTEPDIRRVEAIEEGKGYERPLAIQMEAFLYLADRAPGANEPGVATQLDHIIDLEREHWPKLVGKLDGEGRRPPARHVERAVAQITGVLGVPTVRAAEDLFMVDRRYPRREGDRESVETLTEAVARLYGRNDGGVAHLEPDLIGEHFVAGTADPELIDGCAVWIAAQPEARHATLREQLLTVLQRASQPVHGPKAEQATALLDHLIERQGGDFGAAMVRVMGETPGALFARLAAKVESLDDAAVAAINDALPVNIRPDWFDFALRVADRHLDVARKLVAADAAEQKNPADRTARLNQLAAALGTLGIRYSNLKRLEDALAASEEAVQILRDLYRKNPDVFAEDLARSLSVYSDALRALGQPTEGAAATREGLVALAPLLAARPAIYGDLAGMLVREHLEASQEAGTEPDTDLLERIVKALGGGDAQV